MKNLASKNDHHGRAWVGILAAGIAAYLSALCALPSSGVFSALPTAAVLALVASFFCRERWLMYALMGCMPLCLVCLMGYTVKQAVLYSASCLVQTYLVLLAKRAYQTYKCGRAAVRKKSALVLGVCVLGTLLSWLLVFGNPISLKLAEAHTRRAAQEKYGDTVRVDGATHYDAFTHLYLTEISFEEAEIGKTYYMSLPERDDYADFCRERLYEEAADYFEKQTTLERDGIYVYVDERDMPLSPDTPLEAFRAEMEYLLPLSAGITDFEDFTVAVEQMKRFFALSDTFSFRSVTLASTGLDGEAYYAILSADRGWRIVTEEAVGEQEYKAFDREITEKFPKARHS